MIQLGLLESFYISGTFVWNAFHVGLLCRRLRLFGELRGDADLDAFFREKCQPLTVRLSYAVDSEELFIALSQRRRLKVLRADLLVRAAQPRNFTVLLSLIDLKLSA